MHFVEDAGSKLESGDSIKDLEPMTSQEDMHFKEKSLAVVEKAINDAKVMLATAEGSVSPTAIEATSEQTVIGNFLGLEGSLTC